MKNKTIMENFKQRATSSVQNDLNLENNAAKLLEVRYSRHRRIANCKEAEDRSVKYEHPTTKNKYRIFWRTICTFQTKNTTKKFGSTWTFNDNFYSSSLVELKSFNISASVKASSYDSTHS